MNTKLFMKRLASGLAAVAIVSLGSSAFAANKTWVGSTSSNGSSWAAGGSNTAFGSNWSPTGAPGTADNLTFGSSKAYTLTLVGGKAANTITFSSAAGAQPYTFGGSGLSIGAGGLSNNSGNVQTINSAVTLTANNSWSGNAGVVVGSLNMGNFNLSASKDTTISALTGGTGSYTTSGGTTIINAGTAPANLAVSAGTLKTGAQFDTSAATLAIQSTGTFDNGNVGNFFANVSQSGGTTDLGGTLGKITTIDPNSLGNDSFNMSAGAIKMYAGAPGVNSNVTSDNINLAGTLNIDLNFGVPQVADFSQWNLFTSGALTGDFDSITLSGSNGTGWGSFVKVGGEWTTAATPDANGQWLVFNPGVGSLVVVPEPSTMVFAGVGVAMAGWSAWKKRRLALAKKA